MHQYTSAIVALMLLSTQVASAVPNKHDIGLDIESFEQLLNKSLKNMNHPLKTDLEMKHPEKLTANRGWIYQGCLKKRVCFSINTNNKKMITDMTIIGSGDGTLRSGTNIILTVLGAIRAIHRDPSIDTPHLTNLSTKLMQVKNKTKTLRMGNLEYSSILSEHVGLIVMIGPASPWQVYSKIASENS